MRKDVDVKHHRHALPAINGAWRDFRQEIDQLFDRFSDGFESFSLQPFANLQKMWRPGLTGFANLAVDVSEDDKSYAITAELPGVKDKDIEVSVSDGMLVIKGQKQQEREEKDKNHYLSERSFGSFQRMFSLPGNTDSSKVEARFQNGILTVSVPKNGSRQAARKVEVKAA